MVEELLYCATETVRAQRPSGPLPRLEYTKFALAFISLCMVARVR